MDCLHDNFNRIWTKVKSTFPNVLRGIKNQVTRVSRVATRAHPKKKSKLCSQFQKIVRLLIITSRKRELPFSPIQKSTPSSSWIKRTLLLTWGEKMCDFKTHLTCSPRSISAPPFQVHFNKTQARSCSLRTTGAQELTSNSSLCKTPWSTKTSNGWIESWTIRRGISLMTWLHTAEITTGLQLTSHRANSTLPLAPRRWSRI